MCVYFYSFFVQKNDLEENFTEIEQRLFITGRVRLCVVLLISQKLTNFTVGEILEYLCHPSSQVHSVSIGQLLRVQVCVLQPLGKAASGQAQLSCKRCLLFGLPGSHLNRVGSKGVVCLNGAEHRDLSQGSKNTFVDTQQFSLTNPHPGLLCHSSAFHS